MYDAPFDTLTRLGWVLAAVVLGLIAARAVRVELRAVRGRPRGARVLDVGLDVVVGLAVIGFVAVLVLVVYATFLGWMR